VDRLVKIAQENREALQSAMANIEQAQRLCALVTAVLVFVRQLGVLLAQEELRRRAQARVEWPLCPHCGTRLESRGRVRREIWTLLGLVAWFRKVGRCPKGCAVGHIAPMDEVLGLLPRQKTCASVQVAACLLAVFVPYEIAARILGTLTGVEVSSDAIWAWVQAAACRAKGGSQAAGLAAEEFAVEEEGRPGEVERLPLMIGADGVLVAFRPTAKTPKGKTVWQESKVGVLARLGERVSKAGRRVTVLWQRRVAAVRGDVEKFEPLLWAEALRQGLRSACNVAWISDGSVWLWNLVKRFRDQCPQIVATLDFYHASQNLWKGVEKCFAGDVEAAKQYFEDARHRLRHGTAAEVIEGLKAALEVPDLSEEARKLLTNAYEYLLEHQDHMDYAILKKLGIPIGSGFVESACKWLIQQRFKCVGMRWSEQGFDNLLSLRVAWVNGRFDKLFSAQEDPLPCAA
jgi:hypothetical protein